MLFSVRKSCARQVVCLSRQMCTGLTTSSFAFISIITLLHANMESNNAECSYCFCADKCWQFLQKISIHFYSIQGASSIFLLKENFYKPQTDEHHIIRLTLLLSGMAKGALVLMPLFQVMLTLLWARVDGLISVIPCPRPKSAEVKIQFSSDVMYFQKDA